MIGLGMHNISRMSEWTSDDFRKQGVMEVAQFIAPRKWYKLGTHDFSLLILKETTRFSFKVSPVCLPKIEEIDSLERDNNIVVGFGTSNIWFIEYNKLLGRKIDSVSMITPDLISNKSALIWGFTEGNLEKDIVDGYFKTLFEIFPGFEICVENYDFVCNMTEDIRKSIVENIAKKIVDSGNKNDVGEFLGQLTFITLILCTFIHS